jgi:hypothetical protein
MEGCPVHIHRVTDGVAPTNGVSGGRCPVNHGATNGDVPKEQVTAQNPEEVQLIDIDVDSISVTPSLKEYKKLRNVMAMITRFYRDGSNKKFENFKAMEEELSKLDCDKKMCEEQIAALEEKPYWKIHPKTKEYKKNLQDELEALEKQREGFLKKKQEFFDLYEWSKSIVEVCEWLELNMDDYCKDHMTDLPPSMFKDLKPVPELTEEQKKVYRKGLAEITYNLDESQDFFQASIDGRLTKYHSIEKQMIEAQLKVIQRYPEDNARREHIEAELLKDLEYVKSHMEENPEVRKRREKMLKNHQEFFKVLKYHKDKLGALGQDTELRKYDPKYDHFNDVE